MNMNDCKIALNTDNKFDDVLYCDVDTIINSPLSQKEWAERLGVSEATISTWISSKKLPGIAERAIQYEILKDLLHQYKQKSSKSIVVECNGKYSIYDIPEFSFENGKGKLIAETSIEYISRFINLRRNIFYHINEYKEYLNNEISYADESYSHILEDKLSDLVDLIYYIQNGNSRYEDDDSKMKSFFQQMGENILTEKQSKSPIYRTKEYQEYSKLKVIPDGTKLRMIKHKGGSKGEYYADKINGVIIGKSKKTYYSLSGAALGEIGTGSWNGWTDWECRTPESDIWIKASEIRDKFKNKE